MSGEKTPNRAIELSSLESQMERLWESQAENFWADDIDYDDRNYTRDWMEQLRNYKSALTRYLKVSGESYYGMNETQIMEWRAATEST